MVNLSEKGIDVSAEEASKGRTFHPRCGTSFLFFVILVSIFTYSFIAFFYSHFAFFGLNSVLAGQGRDMQKLILLATNIAMLPFIASVAYEIINCGFVSKNPLFAVFLLYGAFFQLTTKSLIGAWLMLVSIDARGTERGKVIAVILRNLQQNAASKSLFKIFRSHLPNIPDTSSGFFFTVQVLDS